MDDINLKISPEKLESIIVSLELHLEEISEMLPKVQALLKVPFKERLVEVADEDLHETIQQMEQMQISRSNLINELVEILNPPLEPIPHANFGNTKG